MVYPTDKDAVAAGTVAIAGVMALCSELAGRDLLDRQAVKRVGDLMLDATARSEAAPAMQSDLHEAISQHFVMLLDAMSQWEGEGKASED